MKTLSSPQPPRYWRGVCLSSTLAALVLAGGLSTSPLALAQTETKTLATGSGLQLAPNAPSQYTVKRGDTLWDISKTFLNQPWYWPELWYLNPQISNPHLIYPGDVLSLVNIDGQPRLMVTQRGDERVVNGGAVRLSPRVRTEANNNAITTIPYGDISAFLAKPGILTPEEVKGGPHIVAIRDKHIMAGAGDEVYVAGIADANAASRYNVLHVADPLRDPENNDLLGYRSVYAGTGSVQTIGDPAKLQLNEAVREVLPGDKVFPEAYQYNGDFVPHAPEQPISGSIFSLLDGEVAGRYQVVAINRGSQSGLESGHVLAVYEAGDIVKDRYADGLSANPIHTPSGIFKDEVQLPDERIATLMVFKAYDKMSYALVMDADHPITVGNKIGNP